jgi:hypothetical protein
VTINGMIDNDIGPIHGSWVRESHRPGRARGAKRLGVIPMSALGRCSRGYTNPLHWPGGAR